jgi:hypothetical protein
MEGVGLFDDARHNLRLNQTRFFRCVEDDYARMLEAILNNRKVDVNAYNDGVRGKIFIICLLTACVSLFCLCICGDPMLLRPVGRNFAILRNRPLHLSTRIKILCPIL